MHRLAFALAFALAAVLPGSVHSRTFEVPGHQESLDHLEALLQLHRVLGPDTTLWDPWLPMSVLGWQTDRDPDTASLRAAYRERLLHRRIDSEGYVSTQQHEGLAHSEGWPFPLWTQAGGQGWHFTTQGVPYGPESAVHPTASVDDWTLDGWVHQRLDPATGWTLRSATDHTNSVVTLTSPPFRADAFVAPFVRLKWSVRGAGPDAVATLQWLQEGDPDFIPQRRLALPLPDSENAITDVDLPLHRSPGWGGHLVRFRLRFANLRSGTEITLLRLFTAIDSRHNINNAVYLQACDDYLRWTGDLEFLRRNLQRMRLALAWAIHEFQLADRHLVFTPWVGHDGRSGHRIDAEGRRTLLPGVGVGNNYWDLLPFGGEDALATIYYFDAIRRMAALERQIDRHPEWNLPAGPLRFTPAELLDLANSIRSAGTERFWNPATGRFFGWRDTHGNGHDHGFTFVNNEAIYYAFAGTSQARSIREWIDGRRIVPGDTSTGADIYHWRFGPRATTRRNVDTYLWAWSDPASIPWGGQVQDGGAVLGFSFHDLMARLELNGPDDAWNRLRQVINWFAEVRRAGGYRAYYADGRRGSLQGGGTAGGLGLDHEFFESALVPQVMLYGFLGFRPRLDGCLIAPRLPSDWPSLTVRGIRLHDVTLDVTAEPSRLRVQVHGLPQHPLRLFTPGADDAEVTLREGVIEIVTQR